ncbi:hypothetical protein LAZ67_X002401 [Cordylochernes scorpioides]|uniref:Reverse transcriptase n=1 Tax=Cordylochernes scorpioides TaxID=51811 RepID=A0ABY6LVU6_9ARAC|nr:hypothetical protein LAZ67_X002401 [Cordylochernes scorpioides]
MQPHCDELVSRLTDAIRGLAMPRAEEALISPFDGSYAANNFIQQLERTSEGPQDDATLQARLRTLLKDHIEFFDVGFIFFCIINKTGQGRCAELMKLWGYTKDPNCACNVPQSMSHILDDCRLYKFNGGISNLHSVTPEALNWLKALPLRL